MNQNQTKIMSLLSASTWWWWEELEDACLGFGQQQSRTIVDVNHVEAMVDEFHDAMDGLIDAGTVLFDDGKVKRS
jgi:hypothetical protein